MTDPNLPTTTPLLSEKALRVQAEMVFQIASGLADPLAVAKNYGFTEEEFAALSEWEPFRQQVAKTQAEIKANGLDFVFDARLKAKEISDVLFIMAMSDGATFSQRHDALRTFAELGDLKPKAQQQVNTGGGFTININLGDNARDKSPVIDITPSPEPMAVDNPFTLEP